MIAIRYILFLLVAAAVIMTAQADNDETLTFVKTNGTTVAFSANELVITFDDQGNALVKNEETSATIDLDGVDYMCFGDVGTVYITGDVNADKEVNIADINAIINIILGADVETDIISRADVNGDKEVNIADVNAITDIILNAN